MTAFAIYSERVLLPEGETAATVVVREGKIEAIFEGRKALSHLEIIDAGTAILMPGIIDPHVHINEPGRTEWEGFDTATKAAAAGGTTTLVDMPLNSSPVTTTPEAFQEKIAAAEGKLHVNCGFWGGLVPDNAKDLQTLLESGILGMKAFLVHSGIDDFPNVTAADLELAMPQIAATGMPLLVHAELPLPEDISSDWAHSGHYLSWLYSRPGSMEMRAAELLRDMAARHECHTHIVHVAEPGLIPMLEPYRDSGVPMTWETCAHYLFFNAESIPDADPRFKCAPPIREKVYQDMLWDLLLDDRIDFVTTDHSPASPDVKCLDTGDLQQAWGGIHGIQFLLPAVWTEGKKRGLGENELTRLLSENPAKFIGLGDSKGKIEIGYDADLVIWEPEATFVVRKEDMHFRHPISPYEGETMSGVVRKTFVNGHLVFDSGKFVNLGSGKTILKK